MDDQMLQRVAAFNAREDVKTMSALRRWFEVQHAAFGSHAWTEFMLKYGQDYQIGTHSFAGPRATPQQCYKNATLLALEDPALTYVEGKVDVIIPIDHAWCVDRDGVVVDPTLENKGQISGYYGVPFRTDYLRKAALTNRVYGLLDIQANKTLPKLIELGLDAGQQWLLDPKARNRRKSRR